MNIITNICNTDLLERPLSFSVIEAGPNGAIFKTRSVFLLKLQLFHGLYQIHKSSIWLKCGPDCHCGGWFLPLSCEHSPPSCFLVDRTHCSTTGISVDTAVAQLCQHSTERILMWADHTVWRFAHSHGNYSHRLIYVNIWFPVVEFFRKN